MKTNNKTYTYIKKEIPGYYFRPSEPLTGENCDILGSTWNDFQNGKFVPLNEEQIAFAESHPTATIEEVFNMALVQLPIRTLELAIYEKIAEIDNYDKSKAVNSFYLNGSAVWLDKDTRVGLMNSLNIEKAAGKEDSVLWFNDIRIEIKCDIAIQLLSALELYALECYNKTAEHKMTVKTLNNIKDVDGYDYSIGYPKKLRFDL